ncbi:ATP-dependent Clp protease proteolytic subunit [Xanthomonas sacchari]|uniref:ATP-dependent Clp protease proteolytic subunit n=1 Tax=Xanthomonas sacchari TaxID=56458 RepID=A0ABT3DTF2_9XANT|nr:ClpP-like prohead protease/major capsid protein fusion protein [Xanthomonas sacchari]MCW0398762.1 ATP-dependent Clp protease proteolytic subunit [Xanthomonas sacchari]MCW0418410.1 ATP-dependent Clp protease proteolytic subunit [Xanthomonas sacchari]UYK72527.1 ATP-dependent Clp protease proteolytic subunit [Xanthomonas sacchari]
MNHLSFDFTGLHGIAIAPQASPRTPSNRPRIEPVMRLQPISAAADQYELMVYGDIGDNWWGESVTASSVVQQLNELPASVTQINVRINSYGGSVADGLAIFNALKRHSATKAVTVDGVAMSIASLIAMAGDTVTMPATSILMIHAPWGGIMGNAQELRQYANVLDTYSSSMADAYVRKSAKSRDDVLALLTDGQDHYYTGEEAVEAGFADTLDDGSGDADAAPDEQARAFAADLMQRIGARAPARYAGLAIAAAMRGCSAEAAPTQGAAPPNPNPPAATAEHTLPADAGHPSGENEMPNPVDAKAVLAADKQRRESIRAQFAPFQVRTDLDQSALAKLMKECEDDHDTLPEAAGQRLLAMLGTATTPTAVGRPEAGRLTQDETVTYREGSVLAMLHRAAPSAHKLDERAQPFRGFNLADHARDAVERAGQNTRGMTKAEIAVKALQSTSDFPAILETVATRSLRAGYQAAGRTFTQWASQGESLPDFKEVSRVQLAGAPNLKRVVEGAEYEYGEMGDSAEKYRVQKYGRIVAITWETVINDDLGAFTRIPQAFGASAAELESDIVYAILTGNPAMADGNALFSVAHGNLGTAAELADALDAASPNPIAEMRKLMTLQKGVEGRYITVRPRYLIVPPSLEEAALKITSANFVASRGVDQNVFGPSLIPVSEPRLEDASSTAWYGAAESATVDTIEYAYLQGHEGVFTESRNGFEVDGVQVKCRHVFGAKAIDWRGLFKNAGA